VGCCSIWVRWDGEPANLIKLRDVICKAVVAVRLARDGAGFLLSHSRLGLICPIRCHGVFLAVCKWTATDPVRPCARGPCADLARARSVVACPQRARKFIKTWLILPDVIPPTPPPPNVFKRRLPAERPLPRPPYTTTHNPSYSPPTQPAIIMSFAVSPIHLMHLAVAYDAPELVSLDAIIAAHSQGKLQVQATSQTQTTIASIPIELLLQVRTHLLPSLVLEVNSQAVNALDNFENASSERLCTECIEYNEQVYGTAAWSWPNFVQGCDCPRRGTATASRPSTPAPAQRRKAGDKVPRCRREWLAEHLASQLASPCAVWDAVEAMLSTVNCTIARLVDCTHETSEPHVSIVASPSAPCAVAALRRARTEFGLDGEMVVGKSSSPADIMYVPIYSHVIHSSFRSSGGRHSIHRPTQGCDAVDVRGCVIRLRRNHLALWRSRSRNAGPRVRSHCCP
jgi:hypothetical protein